MRLGTLAAAILATLVASAAHAMTFEKVTGPAQCPARICVSANGVIDKDSADAFQQFARANGLGPGTLVALDSEGGNVIESLRLGSQFRKLGVETMVSGYDRKTGAFTAGGDCVSACVYAFLGGMKRHLGPRAKLGVHQVAAPNGEAWKLSAEDGQWVMSLVAVHLNAMGAKLDLLTLALRTRPQDMRYLSEEELVRYAVVTSDTMAAD